MQNTRLYYLDWLRLFAFAILILFHCFRPFDFMGWHIKNDEQSEFLTQVFLFTTTWRMPLLFFVSGAGTYFLLRSGRRGFVPERVKRLMLPFAVGCLLLIPPQKFYEAVHHDNYGGSFFQFLGDYPGQLVRGQLGVSPEWFGLLGYHLWYLPYLFCFSVVLYAFVSGAEGAWRRRFYVTEDASVEDVRRRWALGVLLVLIVGTALRPVFPAYLDWADCFLYAGYFLGGWYYVQVTNQVNQTLSVTRYLWLLVAVTTSLIVHGIALTTGWMIKWVDTPDLSVDYAFYSFLRTLNGIAWVSVVVAFATRYLNRPSAFLAHGNRAILPIYVVHQSLVVVFAFYLVETDLSIPVKLTSLLLLTLVSCIAVYLLGRHSKWTRLCLGYKEG